MVWLTRVTSAGEALAVQRATGRPWRSVIAMILVPFPRLVFPTQRPFFGRDERAIDETFAQIQPAAVLEVLRYSQQHLLENTAPDPLLETTVHGLVRSVSRWQIFPRRTRSKNPEHPI